MKKSLAFTFAASMILLSTSTSHALDAPTAMVPAGLIPGDQFYIMFITSTTIAGNTTVAAYNAHVNAAADLSGVKGTDDPTITWSAWLGHDDSTEQTASLFAADNTKPIYNLGDGMLANDYADLTDGTVAVAIEYDESGATLFDDVWTGTSQNGGFPGVGDDTLGGTDGGNDGCAFGHSASLNQSFFAGLNPFVGCTPLVHMYAVSPLLTVPAAPPAPVGVPSSPATW